MKAGELPADMVRVRMGDASMGELHIVLGDDAQNFFDVPCGIHHRYLASLEGAHQVDKILHGTHFNLFEVKVIDQFALAARDS